MRSKRKCISSRSVMPPPDRKARSCTHHAPRLPTPHAPTAQFAAIAASLHGLPDPPLKVPLRPAREKMNRSAPTETPATIPKRSEYRAQGMFGRRCRSERGSIVRTASNTVAFWVRASGVEPAASAALLFAPAGGADVGGEAIVDDGEEERKKSAGGAGASRLRVRLAASEGAAYGAVYVSTQSLAMMSGRQDNVEIISCRHRHSLTRGGANHALSRPEILFIECSCPDTIDSNERKCG